MIANNIFFHIEMERCDGSEVRAGLGEVGGGCEGGGEVRVVVGGWRCVDGGLCACWVLAGRVACVR